MSFAQVLRPGCSSPRDVRVDVLWLIGLALLLIATGIGLRDPWPADEPRFALIARDMLASGNWLIPHVGGDIYEDKPPLFFWIVAGLLQLSGSLRFALLAPGAIAGIVCVLLLYDLGRRLWSREVGLAAGLGLLATVQFVWQMRQGQIDATLLLFTTLGFYGFVRSLLLGPAWGWYFVAWTAAGLGVITKGVGFLPILILIPYAVARWRRWTAPEPHVAQVHWWLGPLAMVAAIFVWLAPMLIAAMNDPAVARYRDEILFGQTIDRYASAWHHNEPFWYFLVEVIPLLWLPLTALIPWLWRSWRDAFKARDLRVLLPLGWMLLVLLFFSLSTGKRGVYILPALPAFVLACAPYVPALLQRRGPRNAMFAIACALGAIAALGALYGLLEPERRQELLAAYGLDVVPPLAAIAGLVAVVCALARPRRGFLAYGAALTVLLLLVSYWVNPAMDAARSSARFMAVVEHAARNVPELGLVGYKEQYLLQSRRPTVNFGHARWREREREAQDAAAWLAAAPGRALLVDDEVRKHCFSAAHAERLGEANRQEWFLVTGQPDPACAARGDLSAALSYTPPDLP